MKRELGNFERAQVITNEHYPFNAVIVLCINNGPSEDTLKKALEQLSRRQPLLGVHIHKEKERYFFDSEGTPKIPLNMVERQDNQHWRTTAEEELNRQINIFKEPPLRLTYLTGSSSRKESEIVVTFQHVVIDAVSTANFIHELLSLCQKIKTGAALEE